MKSVFVLALICFVVAAQAWTQNACTSNRECTMSCSDNYHAQCVECAASCYCTTPKECKEDKDCPTGAGVGCPPGSAVCDKNVCRCNI